jgi:hypothetical protein
MDRNMLIAFVIEMFMVLVCISQLRMSREESGRRYFATLGVAMAGVISAILLVVFTVYPPPYGFTINAPATELHVCMADGQYIFEIPRSSDSSESRVVMKDLKYDGSGTIFQLPLSIIDDSWQILGYRLTPYGKTVTLHIENAPRGFSANIQESPKASGTPPFEAILSFKIASNATLPHDTYYITVKGVGQDKTEGICEILLKVGQYCERGLIWSIPSGSNNTIAVHNII